MITRRSLLAGAAPLAITLASGVSPFGMAFAQSAPTRGGTLTLSANVEPTTLVATHTTSQDVYISSKIHEGLLTYDYDLTPKPQLATEWSISDDGLRYTFKLRQGVKWHDGKDFTSADVAASINILKSSHPRGGVTFANLVEVQTPDPLTAVIVLSKPTAFLISAFSSTESPIVAKHLYEGVDVRTNPHNQAPVGTGPYVFGEWVRGSHLVYNRNPNYWDEGKPYVDRLVIRFIPDGAARAAALEAGDVLLAGGSAVPLSDMERFKAMPQFEVTTKGYSYSASLLKLEFNLDRDYFKDVRVRQAIAHCIDRQVIADTVYFGYAYPTALPISAQIEKYAAKDIATFPLDIAKAEALLDEAGYKRGADNWRFSVFFDYQPSGPDRLPVATYLRQAIQSIGIKVEIRNQDTSSFVKRVYTDRDFDMQLNFLDNLFDPSVGVQRLYHSANFRPGVPFTNGMHYSNPEVDSLLDQASVETDEKKRYELFHKFQEIVAVEVPSIELVTRQPFTISSIRVKDHTEGAEGWQANLSSVHIEP